MADKINPAEFLKKSPVDQWTELATRHPEYAQKYSTPEAQKEFVQRVSRDLQSRMPKPEPSPQDKLVQQFLNAQKEKFTGQDPITSTIDKAQGILGAPFVGAAKLGRKIDEAIGGEGKTMFGQEHRFKPETAGKLGRDITEAMLLKKPATFSGAVGQGAALGASQTSGDVKSKAIGAGAGAVGGGVGAKAGELIQALRSSGAFKTYGENLGAKIAAQLKAVIPAWSKFPETSKGLYQMAHGPEGVEALDQVMKKAKSYVPDDLVTLAPARLLRAIQLKGRQPLAEMGKGTKEGAKETGKALEQEALGGEGGEERVVPVYVRDLIEHLPDFRRLGWSQHREAWSLIEGGLDKSADTMAQTARKALDGARQAYKFGSGWIEFASKGKFLSPDGKLDPIKMSQTVRDFGNRMLGSRGMKPVQEIAGEGAGIKRTPLTQWERRGLGFSAGEGIGHAFGVPPWMSGPAGAFVGEAALPRNIYTHIPGVADKIPGLVAPGAEAGKMAGEFVAGKGEEPK